MDIVEPKDGWNGWKESFFLLGLLQIICFSITYSPLLPASSIEIIHFILLPLDFLEATKY